MQFVAAHITEILCLAISVDKRVAEVHNTGLFWTVIESKCMTDLMCGFLEQTFNKQGFIGT
jgi:hypothetical protein